MNRSIWILFAAASLGACDRPAAVVAVPAQAPAPVAVPGPAGPTGATGMTGQPGQPGEGTTVIVVPPAASAASQ